MAYVIGLDFGNYNSFPCVVVNGDVNNNRLSGMVVDLLPRYNRAGIPSAFFYSGREKFKNYELPWYGDNAVSQRAVPLKNRVRLLKRHLGESITIDDKCFSYDEEITNLIQYIIRKANEELQKNWMEITDLVSISYPATYSTEERMHLVSLVENATLEDGRHVKVYGTICEPAAASLDYLAEYQKEVSEETVLTYDLGGGTFDLAIVTAYPNGKRNANGKTYYYDVVDKCGIAELGGNEFDQIIQQILVEKLTPEQKSVEILSEIVSKAEEVKIELSNSNETWVSIYNPVSRDYIDIEITRAEFEKASEKYLQDMINLTNKILADNPSSNPKYIILTGGSSQMPMIKKAIKKAFPSFSDDQIVDYRPTKAIAYGAARYGVVEQKDIYDTALNIVQQHAEYEIGVRFLKDKHDILVHIHTFVPEKADIPYHSSWVKSYVIHENTSKVNFRVFEAIKKSPDCYNIKNHYKEILSVVLDFKRILPIGTECESQIIVDKKGVLKIISRLVKNHSIQAEGEVKLKNLG